MLDEIEPQLEGAIAIGHTRGGEAARGDVERHVPPMIDERGEAQANLADDLRPHVEGGVGIFPGIEREGGPAFRLIGSVWHGESPRRSYDVVGVLRFVNLGGNRTRDPSARWRKRGPSG